MTLKVNEVAGQLHRHLCTHASHGYTWGARWGNGNYNDVVKIDGRTYGLSFGDRDCSSSVIDSWRNAVVYTPYKGCFDRATYTGNMRSVFVASGLFEVQGVHQAQIGDIYLNDTCHTAMSQGGGLLSEFSIAENGTCYGAEGDQTGWESHITNYYNYPWNCVLHYNGKADKYLLPTKKIEEVLFMAQKNEFTFVVHPDKCGKLFFVSGAHINHIPNEEALKYLKKAYKSATGADIPMFAMGSKKAPEGLRLFQALGQETLYNKEVKPTIK